MDLILSSGFLAFARHIGVLEAIEERGIEIEGICGTSSGAMVGALYAAGHSLETIAAELYIPKPINMVSFSWRPWSGLLSMGPVQSKLSQLLPKTFAELERPFGVGLCTMDRKRQLCTSGNLVDAVIASCSVPYMFVPHKVEGTLFRDGGFADRLMAEPWRAQRDEAAAIVHIVERSAGVGEELGVEGCTVVRTPRSHAKLWNLGDFDGQRAEAKKLAQEAFASLS
ncbi:MAG: hypothetical protein CMK59_05015 [Proteobacteria bacterium]|nr:hypothetical protein [Pseudomonadota bacterium]